MFKPGSSPLYRNCSMVSGQDGENTGRAVPDGGKFLYSLPWPCVPTVVKCTGSQVGSICCLCRTSWSTAVTGLGVMEVWLKQILGPLHGWSVSRLLDMRPLVIVVTYIVAELRAICFLDHSCIELVNATSMESPCPICSSGCSWVSGTLLFHSHRQV